MLRFKQFSGSAQELEVAVNRWLAQNEPDVTQMVQTVNNDGSIAIAFLFEESFRGQELRLSEEHRVPSPEVPAPAAAMPDAPVVVSPESVSSPGEL